MEFMMPVLLQIESLSIFESLETSFLGFMIVFFVLFLLLVMIRLLRTVTDKLESSPISQNTPSQADTPAIKSTNQSVGSKGEAKLHDVDDKTAATLMAIVTDAAKLPPGELRVNSIVEKKSEAKNSDDKKTVKKTNGGQRPLNKKADAKTIELNKTNNFQIGKGSVDGMKYSITLNGKVYEIEVERGQAVLINESEVAAQPVTSAPVSAAPTQASAQATVPVSGKAVTAPLPGTVWSISANVGDIVKAGQVLLILEAMKMENEIVAPHDGRVAQIVVSRGMSVNTGDTLITLA